jgi:methyl-accepting chemotaxis protein
MLANMKIGIRLGLGFLLLLVLMLAVGGAGYWGVRTSTDATIRMLNTDAKVAEQSARVRANVLGCRRFEKDMFLNITDNAKVVEYKGKWKDVQEHLAARLADLEKLVTIAKDKDAVKSMKKDMDEYDKGMASVMAMIAAGKIKTPEEGNKAISVYKEPIHNLESVATDLAAAGVERMEKQDKVMMDLARQTIIVIAICIIAALIFSILVGILLTRSITAPLNDAVDAANRLAKGDLTVSVAVNSRDEVGQFMEALGAMTESLRTMIGKIRTSSDQVASAANQISAGSNQLTKAAHSQASAAEETSSTMVQMAASIQTVAANADSLANNADEVASTVQELGATSEQLAKGAETMSSSVSETSATIEQMTISIDKVAQNTDELASSVAETSSTIEQMTVSIDQVAGSSQELQSVVTETAAIVEQMAVSVGQVAKNVEEADAVAKTAAKEGYAGKQAVEEALASMNRVAGVIQKTADSILNLDKRSEEIGSIVKVINEIADQTNLLALNAAIEAARAGDAGRGFAVVAEEVRKLAERSVNATKEIGLVIKQVQVDTSNSVKYGELASNEAKASMELSNVAGNALENIVSSVEQTSNLMTSISATANEQAKASTQVLQAVERMSRSSSLVATAAKEQALGGRQIRTAVERMNNLTQEVTGATKEQTQGSRQIRTAVENMNHVTSQVAIATKEQALSARQIADAITAMNTMTQSVANATAEQKKGGEMVVAAVENISDITRENLSSVEQLSKAAQNLSTQAIDLATLVAAFKVN